MTYPYILAYMINCNKNLIEFHAMRFGLPNHPNLHLFLYRNAIKTFPTRKFCLIDAMLNENNVRIMKPLE